MLARPLLIKTVVVGLCATAVVAIVVLLTGSFDDTTWQILATTSAVSFFALLSVPAGAVLERGRPVALGRASAALTAAGFLLTLVVIWDAAHAPSWLWRTWGVVVTLAA